MIPNIPPKHNIFSTSLQTYKNLSSPYFPTEPSKKEKKIFKIHLSRFLTLFVPNSDNPTLERKDGNTITDTRSISNSTIRTFENSR